ncbi:MAG: S24 family peptidase [Cyanobacteria bacterium P01_F01_bin.150]
MSKKRGRPTVWGELPLSRPRIPLEVDALLNEIRHKFTEPLDAYNYILSSLSREPEMQTLRLYDSRVSATPGITGNTEDEAHREISIPRLFMDKPERAFLVKVAGDSMRDAGINHGDVILAERINPLFECPQDRKIVVAIVHNDQLVIKRYRKRQRGHELLSENHQKDYPSIWIQPDMSEHMSSFIFGVFHRVIPQCIMEIGTR